MEGVGVEGVGVEGVVAWEGAGIIFNTRARGVRWRECTKKIGASRKGSSDLLCGQKTCDVLRMEVDQSIHRYTCYRQQVPSLQ